MNTRNQVQKLLEGCPDFPTLQDVAAETEPEVFLPRTDAEDACRAVLPGDSLEGHVFEDTLEPNPYLGIPASDLREMLEWMEGDERRDVERALVLKQLQHSDGMMPGRS